MAGEFKRIIARAIDMIQGFKIPGIDELNKFLSMKIERPDWLGRYKVEVIIIRDGINDHIIKRFNEFPARIKYKDTVYDIKANALFHVSGARRRIKNFLFRLITNEFIILFREGEKDPVLSFTAETSPEVLKVARTSTAVSSMVKEWFEGRRFPINKWAFILIVATIGTIIYAKLSGRW